MKMRGLIRYFAFLFSLFAVSSSFGQENLPAVVKRVEPSVVVILTFDKEGKLLGQGSGFFVSKNGDVITSRHVLQGAKRAEVKTANGKVYAVKRVLAEDAEGDLIRVSADIPGDSVHPLSVSAVLPEVGERIIVIGSPFGLEMTVSDGIVSAIREILEFGKIIQVTAPISPGSSGSPVVNMKGEVIGVATFFIVAGQNLNFAIPVERIAKLAPGEGQLLSAREERRIEEWVVSPEGLYATGLRYLWVEEYEKALPYFVEAVKKNANHADAYNNLCMAYAILERYAEAVASCKEAILLKPDLAEAHSNLGWSYHKLGRYQEAIQSCKQAIHIKPDFAMAHYNLGNNHIALGEHQEAIESYKQAIRIKFDYAEAHLNLGAAYNRMGRYEEAIESYRQAIRLKPRLAEAHLDLGMTYLRTGDRGSALEEYKILKELDKNLPNKLFNLIYE